MYIPEHTNKSAIKKKTGPYWYRYLLVREWNRGRLTLGVIMLNPSLADGTIDDPTIRRVCDFADRWGYGRVIVGNLYAVVSPDPRILKDMRDPVGAWNDEFLRVIRHTADVVIAGWGTKADPARVQEVAAFMRPLMAFKLTKDGHPSHPLYLPKDIKPVVYVA